MDIVQHRDADQPGDYGCAQSGCTICLEKLLQQHAGLVHFMVYRQWPGEADYADLIQEGWIGLWQAILHYDVGRGVTFSTYAGRAGAGDWRGGGHAGAGPGRARKRTRRARPGPASGGLAGGRGVASI